MWNEYHPSISLLSKTRNKKNILQWYSQEGGDPSHGMRKLGLAQACKDEHNVVNLEHPAQSPDLNPIEGIWNTIKQQLCCRIFDSEEEMK